MAILTLKDRRLYIIIADRALIVAGQMFRAMRIHDMLLFSQNQSVEIIKL